MAPGSSPITMPRTSAATVEIASAEPQSPEARDRVGQHQVAAGARIDLERHLLDGLHHAGQRRQQLVVRIVREPSRWSRRSTRLRPAETAAREDRIASAGPAVCSQVACGGSCVGRMASGLAQGCPQSLPLAASSM